MGRGKAGNWKLKRKSSKRSDKKKTTKISITEKQVRDRWDTNKTARQNYKEMGLIYDPNKELFEDIKTDNPIEFAPPKKSACTSLAKLSYFEIKYVEALLKKYGRDVRKMSLDHKLNVNQCTQAQLKKMIKFYDEMKEEKEKEQNERKEKEKEEQKKEEQK